MHITRGKKSESADAACCGMPALHHFRKVTAIETGNDQCSQGVAGAGAGGEEGRAQGIWGKVKILCVTP